MPQDKKIFVKDDGRPVRFFLHRSVKEGANRITSDIQASPPPPPELYPLMNTSRDQKHGGKVVRDDGRADVVLVDEEEDIDLIRRRYHSNPDLNKLGIYVETRGFVKRCLRNDVYRHQPPRRHAMPGRPAGGPNARAYVLSVRGLSASC